MKETTIELIRTVLNGDDTVTPELADLTFRVLPSSEEGRAGSGGKRSKRDKGAASIKRENPAKAWHYIYLLRQNDRTRLYPAVLISR